MAYRTYTGEDVDIQFNLKRCIHAKECVTRLNAVFDTDKRPWIQPDEADGQAVADTIQRCPTGALQYESKTDAVANETPEAINTVQLIPDGPLYVRGDLKLQGAEDQSTRLALCRCGMSENKPYCDNSHIEAGFKAGSTLEQIEPARDLSGNLEIKTYTDGPIDVKGDFRLLNENGDTLLEAEHAVMCRCGASQNKPFCDGTHKKIDFRAP